ncbi:MAG: HAD family phosphatase [Dehalococcoidia bacterium]|nr:HAD family phosphatase [Dehalococcoidia bacterium]
MTAMRYRLAAFDIDGTLVGPSGKLSPATIAAVDGLAGRGVVVAAATARPYELALPTLQPLGGAVSAVIAAAGADIRRANGEPIAQVTLPPEAARAIAQLCDEHDWRAVGGTEEGAFRRLPTPEARGPAATVASLTEVALGRTYVIAPFTGPEDPAFAALESAVQDAGLRAERALTSSGHEIVAVTHPDAGKGPALLRLCEAFAIPPGEAVAFGDTEVDLPMIELAGLGVAMADAPRALKEAADLVTGTAREDGVASAIQRIWGEG